MSKILKQILFYLTRYSYLTSRYAVWWFTGRLKLFKFYNTSAHVERIIWRSRMDIFDSVRPYHFIGSHIRFDDPQCVLADDVILMCVTETKAIFLRMPQTIWQYSADKVPFCWITLFEEAIETITLPMWALHRIADELGEIKQPSMIISNQGRCGSTLLCKLLHLSDPRILVLSEPDPLQCLREMLKRRRQLGTEFLRIVKSAVRLSFKPVTGADAIVIKVRMTAMRIVRYVALSEPSVKHVYMLRKDLLKTVQSWERVFSQALQAKVFAFLSRLGLIAFFVGRVFSVDEDSQKVIKKASEILNMRNKLEIMLSAWADNATAYYEFKKEFELYTLYYEELLAKPEDMLRETIQYLGVEPQNNIQIAVEQSFLSDSQKDTPLSMAANVGKKAAPYTPEVKQRVDKFLDALNLPHLD